MIEEIGRTESGLVRPSHSGFKAIPGLQSLIDFAHVLPPDFVCHGAAEGFWKEAREKSVGILERCIALHGPESLIRIWTIRPSANLANFFPHRRAHARMSA